MTAEKKAEKKALRSRMVAWRKKIQPSLRQGMSQCILGRLFQMDAFRQAQTVFAYASMPDEVQLDALLKACLSQGKRIGIPEITGPGIMEAAELESMEDLVTGKFGIRSLRELKQATRKLQLNIGCIVTPVASTPAKVTK